MDRTRATREEADSFAATNADWVAVAKLLVAAGARVEAKFVDMAVPPLADWLAGV